jgi:hypothetical protein
MKNYVIVREKVTDFDPIPGNIDRLTLTREEADPKDLGQFRAADEPDTCPSPLRSLRDSWPADSPLHTFSWRLCK